MQRARVLLGEPVGLLDYRVPDAMCGQLAAGVAVRVPLGNRTTGAYVVELGDDAAPEGIVLRDIEALDGARPQLPIALLELLLFAADYYGVPPGEMLAAALPAVHRRAGSRFRLSDTGKEVLERGDLSAGDKELLGAAAGYTRGFTGIAIARVLGLPLTAAAAKLRRAAARGWLARVVRGVGRARAQPPSEVAVQDLPERPPEPTPAQAEAIAAASAALASGTYRTFLVQGVTGSGKTEVYLRVIAETLARERGALVLVPEIALTPQLGERFRRRFGERVATFHSGLTAAERRDEWERMRAGEAAIGLGARSAVFLPVPRLGAIIVDEEHETSFKQDESPRYHARDLAVWRGQREGAVVLLGSATPSLESRANCDTGRYRRVLMPARVMARPLPQVELISLADARPDDGVFTVKLGQAIEETLAAGEQVVLFLNRRGFAPYLFCRDCGFAYRCADCAVSLTWHKRRGVLLCHYCGFEEQVPDVCPKCGGHRLEDFGLGTERLEAMVHQLFGGVATARLDRDTVRRRADLDRQLKRFAAGEAKILIGTQMVAKGHDFPGVTLVGVIAADLSLNFPDFRAAERTFQLLTQVAGRAGRGARPGRVLVQTYDTEHYAIRAAQAQDYDAFAAREMASRKELDYPPFVHLALLRFESAHEGAGEAEATKWAQHLREVSASARLCVTVLGPAPAPLARLRGQWRHQVLLKAKGRSALRSLLQQAHFKVGRGVRRILDVDPVNML